MRNKDFFKKDKFSYDLVGIKIVNFKEGYAKVALEIEHKHLNGVNITQGGVLFTLADYALAIASNAKDNITALTTNISIYYLKSTTKGNTITAEAKEIEKAKKISTYQINIYDEQQHQIAAAIGNTYIANS